MAGRKGREKGDAALCFAPLSNNEMRPLSFLRPVASRRDGLGGTPMRLLAGVRPVAVEGDETPAAAVRFHTGL